jgi:hypothetical protein
MIRTRTANKHRFMSSFSLSQGAGITAADRELRTAPL